MTTRKFELLTIPIIHQHLRPVVDVHLQQRDFVSLKPLQWVRSSDAPIRQVFEFRQLKGGALAPAWGYSFDFVPHFSGREMKWHKTEKAACFDAFVDGQYHRAIVLTYMYGVPGLLENLEDRVAAAVQLASQFWDAGNTPERVYSIVAELRYRPGSSLFAQLPIANAFCLARNGRAIEGKAELELVIQDRSRFSSTKLSDKTVAKVWSAFQDAVRS